MLSDASKLLQTKTTSISDATITSSKPGDLQEDDVDDEPTSIVVTGFDPTVNTELLQLYFESERKSVGGKLESITYEEDRNRAILKFESETGILKQVFFANLRK